MKKNTVCWICAGAFSGLLFGITEPGWTTLPFTMTENSLQSLRGVLGYNTLIWLFTGLVYGLSGGMIYENVFSLFLSQQYFRTEIIETALSGAVIWAFAGLIFSVCAVYLKKGINIPYMLLWGFSGIAGGLFFGLLSGMIFLLFDGHYSFRHFSLLGGIHLGKVMLWIFSGSAGGLICSFIPMVSTEKYSSPQISAIPGLIRKSFKLLFKESEQLLICFIIFSGMNLFFWAIPAVGPYLIIPAALLFQVIFYRTAVNIVRGIPVRPVNMSVLSSNWKNLFILGFFLLPLSVLTAFMTFLPGIFFALCVFSASFSVADGEEIIPALLESSSLIRKKPLFFFIFTLISLTVIITGFLPACALTVLSVPAVFMCSSLLYLNLRKGEVLI